MTKLVEVLHFELDCYVPFPPDGRIPNYDGPDGELRMHDVFDAEVPIRIDPLRTRYWGHGRDDCTDISKSQYLSQPLGG